MRRNWLIATSLVVGMYGGGPQAPAAGNDQSQFAVSSQINLAHTGSINFPGGFAPPLVQVWSTDIGEGVWFYPLIAKNSVFLSGDGEDVIALNLSTGVQEWKQSLDCCNEQGAYDNGALFFLSDSGELTALSAKTGNELWKIQLTGETSFPAPPIAANGQVFANGEGSNAIAYSVSEKNGSVLWSQHTTGAGLPSLASGALFLTSSCFYYRLDPSDGSIIWTSEQCVGGGWESSAYANKRLYVPGIPTGNIVSAASGAVLGSYPTWDYAPALFTDAKGKARGLSLFNLNDLICWDAKSGKQVWEYSSEYDTASYPVVINGVVYITDSSGTLYALNQKNGKKLWSDTFGSGGAGLSAAQGTLLLTSGSEVIAYQPQ